MIRVSSASWRMGLCLALTCVTPGAQAQSTPPQGTIYTRLGLQARKQRREVSGRPWPSDGRRWDQPVVAAGSLGFEHLIFPVRDAGLTPTPTGPRVSRAVGAGTREAVGPRRVDSARRRGERRRQG